MKTLSLFIGLIQIMSIQNGEITIVCVSVTFKHLSHILIMITDNHDLLNSLNDD